MRIVNSEVKLMAKILPSSDLRNKYNEISNFCNTYHEPVYITKNGTCEILCRSWARTFGVCRANRSRIWNMKYPQYGNYFVISAMQLFPWAGEHFNDCPWQALYFRLCSEMAIVTLYQTLDLYRRWHKWYNFPATEFPADDCRYRGWEGNHCGL